MKVFFTTWLPRRFILAYLYKFSGPFLPKNRKRMVICDNHGHQNFMYMNLWVFWFCERKQRYLFNSSGWFCSKLRYKISVNTSVNNSIFSRTSFTQYTICIITDIAYFRVDVGFQNISKHFHSMLLWRSTTFLRFTIFLVFLITIILTSYW
jgi:hypothetical protein